MRPVAAAFELRDDAGADWAAQHGSAWTAAWESCPRADWLLVLCEDLPMSVAPAIRGVVEVLEGATAELPEDTDEVRQGIRGALVALRRWASGEASPERVFSSAHALFETCFEASPLAQSVARSVDYMARAASGDRELYVAGEPPCTDRVLQEGAPAVDVAHRELADRIRAHVPIADLEEAVRRGADPACARAGRLLLGKAREDERVCRSVSAWSPELAPVMAALGGDAEGLDRIDPYLRRAVLAWGDDLAAGWQSCPRGSWLLELLGIVEVDRGALLAAAVGCARLALEVVPASGAFLAPRIDAVAEYASGEASDARCRELLDELAEQQLLEDTGEPPSTVLIRTLLEAATAETHWDRALLASMAVREAANVLGGGGGALVGIDHLTRLAHWRCAERVREDLPAARLHTALLRASDP